MKALNKIKFVIDKVTEVISIIVLAVMTILTVYQVIARFIFNNPSSITEALAQYLFVWLIMFGSAYVYGSREHLTIDLLRDRFSPKLEMIIEILSNICLFVFVLAVCVIGGYIYAKGQAVQIDPSLLISKAVLYAALPVTGVITLFYCIYNSALAVHKYKTGEQDTGEKNNSLV